MKLDFFRHFFKINGIYFTKTLPVGAKLFHANREIDMTKVIVAFRNSAKTPNNRQLGYVLPNLILD